MCVYVYMYIYIYVICDKYTYILSLCSSMFLYSFFFKRPLVLVNEGHCGHVIFFPQAEDDPNSTTGELVKSKKKLKIKIKKLKIKKKTRERCQNSERNKLSLNWAPNMAAFLNNSCYACQKNLACSSMLQCMS